MRRRCAQPGSMTWLSSPRQRVLGRPTALLHPRGAFRAKISDDTDPTMPRCSGPIVSLLLFASAIGCSPYEDDFEYAPRPSLVEVRATSPQRPPVVTALVSVIGVRREDRNQAIPQSIEIRIRLENNGSDTVAFDPRTLNLTNSRLIPFPPPLVRPPGAITLGPTQSVTLTAFFPLPRISGRDGDLDSLELRWIVQVGEQKVSQSASFRRVYPRFYYYDPYWAYPAPYYWYGGVVFVHGR